jgi:N4-gp56 family major capsid protein
MLKTAAHVNVTARYATVDPLPRNAGDTLKLRRYEDLPIPDAPLSEILDPEATMPTYTDVEVVVEQYGAIMRLTQKIKDMHEDPIFQIEFDKAGKQAGQCSQKVDFNALKAGTNVAYAAGVTARTSVAARISNNDLKKIVRQFKRDGASTISRRIKATPDIGTEPVPEGFVAFGHTDMLADLEDLDGWLPVHKYPNPTAADPGEAGTCEGIRFILSNEAPISLAGGASGTTYLSNGEKVSVAASCDVYHLIVIGQDSYSRVPLAGKQAIKPMVVNPGTPSAADPTGRKGYISWLAYLACVITNEAWVCRYESAVTAL